MRAAALLLAAFTAIALTGCGERAGETEKQTEKQTETEAVTEVVILTEKQTETETETEPATEAVTEAVTEAPAVTEEDLPADEELAAAADFDEYRTMYANDDINVRDTPSTESSDSIFSSYDQGQEATVTGETPHWYKVLKGETTGYVHKNGLSDSPVDAKTEEERAAAIEAELANAAETAVESAASSDAETSYSESFTIVVASDANLRAGASETADVLNVIASGSTAVALGETGDWYQVDYNGTIGYVNKNLVE